MRRGVVPAVALVALVGGGPSASAAGGELAAQRVPTATAASYACSGTPPFPRSALRRPRGYERLPGPEGDALREFLRESGRSTGQDLTGWFLLAQTQDELAFASGPGPEYGLLRFERRGDGWSWLNSGGCRPRAYRDGREAVPWRLAEPARSGATSLKVLVEEEDCASGRDARGRILRPRAHYGRRALTLTFHVRSARGSQSCPSNPPTPLTVRLAEPVGRRAVRDGGPPSPRRVR